MLWLDWLVDSAKRRGGGLGEFGSLANGTLECPKKKCRGWTGSWTLPKGVAEGWGSFEAWQTAPLNAQKEVPWLDWLVDIAKRRGAGLGEF